MICPSPTPNASRYSSGVPTASARLDSRWRRQQRTRYSRTRYRPAGRVDVVPCGTGTDGCGISRSGSSVDQARRSIRLISRPGSSVDQAPAGRPQEHVLQRGSADQRGCRADPEGLRRREGDVAVVGVGQQPIGQGSISAPSTRTGACMSCISIRSTSGVTAASAASWVPGRNRSSNTSRELCSAIGSAGEPWATIRPLCITTSRSHGCSASSM